MAFLKQHKGLVFPKVAAVLGALVFAAGSVLVFAAPNAGLSNPSEVEAKPTPTATYSHPKPGLVPKPKATKANPSAKPTPKPKATPSPSPTSSPSAVQPSRTGPVPKVTPIPTLVPAPTTNSVLRAQVISLINQKRAQVGVNQLASSSRLSDQCQSWSTSMASRDVLQHSSMDYRGEIIASGPTTAERVVQLWMNSPSHREIMLSSRYTLIGSGYVNGYWTVQFG
jgi:uncharacterized protein YkwD